jgi:hypothetical protein
MYPLVTELAVDGIPVTVTCRVLNIARQPYYRWLKQPSPIVSSMTPIWRTRSSTPTETIRSSATGSSPTRSEPAGIGCVTAPCGLTVLRTAGGQCSENPKPARTPSPALQPTTTWSAACSQRTPEPPVAHRYHRAPHRRRQALFVRGQRRLLETDCRLLDRGPDESQPGGRSAQQRCRPPRGDVAGCILHSDRGSQGGFNRLSQHLEMEVIDGSSTGVGRQGASSGDAVARETDAGASG